MSDDLFDIVSTLESDADTVDEHGIDVPDDIVNALRTQVDRVHTYVENELDNMEAGADQDD